jgi:hypothetical protein
MRYCYLLCAACLVSALASPAGAYPQFQKAFQDAYLKSLKDKKVAEAMEKGDVKCLVCHQGKQTKKNRNDFGKVVGKLLTKKDVKNNDKIVAELKKALATHVDPKNEKSETYLDRLNKGQWPGGKLEDLKKEPKKEAGKDAAAEGEKKE